MAPAYSWVQLNINLTRPGMVRPSVAQTTSDVRCPDMMFEVANECKMMSGVAFRV